MLISNKVFYLCDNVMFGYYHLLMHSPNFVTAVGTDYLLMIKCKQFLFTCIVSS